VLFIAAEFTCKTFQKIIFLKNLYYIYIYIACLHDQNKRGFYPANHSNLKSLQKALIGWKKAGPPKKPFLF